MVDGTFWTDDEMPRLGCRSKHAREIGHLAAVGPGRHDRVAGEAAARRTRRLLIHINNTNPILDEDSEARATLVRARASKSARTA